ncbi:Rieske-like 2Fe-2S protein [Algoriphagus aquaeductus]|uniref:Rieske-like 2Fe-2S protein n=1 Tax=Algoriphagus aquaeductus TaxID=475299 RepID=A0A326RP12_9BACT|nr:ubiquinol-cytochrome c reductase iron-sulfur subunit [Algoriphagus aquaeductus]PZV83155.1 Rieske-like 2Fe-2S protein [Algoriphagus aquaeductus]
MGKHIESIGGSLTDSRRKFIEKAGLATIMSTFGVAFFTSCSSTEDADPNNPNNPPSGDQPNGITISGTTVRIDLSVQTRLAASGGWLLIQNARTLVANVNGSYVAMTSVCTHSGCFDSWTFANNRFTCTCHGSVFDPSGRVLQGPAASPLQQYTTQLSGTTLTITR